MSIIDKKTLEHLAELARLELPEKNKEKFIEDLGEILDYFKELQKVDTSKIEPMTGGTNLKNITREDEFMSSSTGEKDTGKGVEAFPETKNSYLKVPPVFE